jgi:tetratricopeptide (TPR) repeat protein
MNLTLRKAHAFAAAIAGATLAVTALAAAFGWRDLPAPFVWLDVAVVYFLAALPLAASFAAAALLQLPLRRSSLVLLGVEAVVLVLIPRLYIQARCKRDLNEAMQLSRQFRYAEASALMHRLMDLKCEASFQGNSLASIVANMDQIVRDLEWRVAPPLPDDATDADRLDRAEKLAVLGRTREAIAILDSSSALATTPEACILLATVHENSGQWLAARQSFVQAKNAFQSQPDSPARPVGLEQAVTGIAFCERKLGRLREAEGAWQELLALAPTADTHFLMAQFYEDTQQAAKAQFHARQAIALAPERNDLVARARQLQDKLITSHFGCFGVFRTEQLRPNTLNAYEDSAEGSRRD